MASTTSTGTECISECIHRHLNNDSAAGVVAMVHHREAVQFETALGFSDLSSKQPMTTDCLFRIASMTKPVTSIAALILIEEGLLTFDDTIDHWLPELSNMRVLVKPDADLDQTELCQHPIIVQDLLLHRSGLCYPITASASLESALREFNSDIFPTVNADTWLRKLGELPLRYQPGTRWHYGYSTDVLSVLIERVSGIPFSQFLRERIFDPLDMRDTDFWVSAADSNRLACAYANSLVDGSLNELDSDEHSRWTKSSSFPSGGAGLISTARDFLQFTLMMKNWGCSGNERLLSKKSLELMCSNHLTKWERENPFLGMDYWRAQGFGLGVAVVDNPCLATKPGSLGAVNWPGAYGCSWIFDRREDVISILMLQNYWGESSMSDDFHSAVYESLDVSNRS